MATGLNDENREQWELEHPDVTAESKQNVFQKFMGVLADIFPKPSVSNSANRFDNKP